MFSRVLIALFLLAVMSGSWAQSRQMALGELIAALQGRGYSILYSSALVPADHAVSVDSIDLDSLRGALLELDLVLLRQDEVWVIARAEAPDPPPLEKVELPVLETVIVTGSLHRLPYIGATQSAYSFTPEDLALVPTLGSDAIRATLRLPGVSSVGVSAKPRIRGGLQDELLVIQDNVELLEPFHLADYHSAYSAIDYHTIESLDVYTGGFPSRYGNRMSGVMDIRNQWQDDDYNTDIGVSSFANFLHTRGEFGSQRPGSWLLSLREGDLTDLTDYIDTRAGDPKYKDAAARVSFELSETLSMSAGLVYAEDDIVFDDEEEAASSQIDTVYAWLGADWLLSPKLGSRFTLSWLDFSRDKRQASFEEDEEDPGKGGFLDHQQDINRIALRNDWSAFESGRHWEFGWQLEYHDGEYDHRSLIDRGELAEILGTESEIERDIHVAPDGWSGGGYLQLEWDANERLIIQPSLRWDFQNYYLESGSEQQISPRLGIAYQLSSASRLRLSAGRFHQQEAVHELQVIDGITHFFAPQYSDQVVLGLDWSGFQGDLELVAEIYYKRYGDQKGRYENIFNPFVLLPEMEPDRVGLFPDKAIARGFDLDARFALAEPLSGFFRYSYMDAEDRIKGEWADRRWSQQHTVNTGLIWQGESFSLSLAATWHSGWRTTVLPPYVPEDTVIPVEHVLNNTELDDYFSLDFGIRKHWEIGATRVEVYADIINITDHRNLAGIDFDVEEVEGGYELAQDFETLLGRVPSVGITLSF
jgi:outer membrane receptor protein involved in Fe transport